MAKESILLSFDDRRALGQRAEQEIVECPICEGKAERARNGAWACIDAHDEGWGAMRYSVRNCGARGVTVDGELIWTSKPHIDEDETDSLQDSD